MMADQTTKRTRTVSGIVASAKRDKTITVVVERKVQHPLYRKYVKQITKLHAHDEENLCSENDKVVIRECRPLSKTKCWQLVRIVERAT